MGPVLLLTGCSFLPSAGPSSGQIKSSAKEVTDVQEPEAYQVIRVTNKVVTALSKSENATSDSGLSTLASPETDSAKGEALFRVTGMNNLPHPPRQVIAAGDTINVTIYDSGGGLLGSSASSMTAARESSQGGAGPSTGSATFPPQVVDESGQITVPFAGRIQVTGRTTYEVEQDIVTKLRNKALDPQAVVTTMGHGGANMVTVTGDVKTPMLVPVSLNGTRLLEAITAAGGSTSRAYQTSVSVIRGTVARSDSLGDIMRDISKNILLQPGDTVIVNARPWSYLAFGAMGAAMQGKASVFPFGGSSVSLAEAMANAGGGQDARGMLSIYLYRLEPTKFIAQMGIKPIKPAITSTPVIYLLDLHSPEGFFLAQRFAMRDKDIIYFPNSDSVGVLKFLNILNALTAPVRSNTTTVQGLSGGGL